MDTLKKNPDHRSAKSLTSLPNDALFRLDFSRSRIFQTIRRAASQTIFIFKRRTSFYAVPACVWWRVIHPLYYFCNATEKLFLRQEMGVASASQIQSDSG